MAVELPESARVVIVGGGVIGCSVAYHLTRLGWRDVLVLERDQLTSGTTWHAAGLIVSGLLMDETSADIFTYSRDLYQRLEAETGLATGFKSVGYLQVACNEERLEEMRRSAAFMRNFGIDCHEISVAEARDHWPGARFDDVIGAFYTAEDGRANPVDVTMSLAKGARLGARPWQKGLLSPVSSVRRDGSPGLSPIRRGQVGVRGQLCGYVGATIWRPRWRQPAGTGCRALLPDYRRHAGFDAPDSGSGGSGLLCLFPGGGGRPDDRFV